MENIINWEAFPKSKRGRSYGGKNQGLTLRWLPKHGKRKSIGTRLTLHTEIKSHIKHAQIGMAGSRVFFKTITEKTPNSYHISAESNGSRYREIFGVDMVKSLITKFTGVVLSDTADFELECDLVLVGENTYEIKPK